MQQRQITLIISLFIIFLFCSPSTNAQNSSNAITLSGYIKDQQSLETLIGANIYIKELETGATTNLYGYYALKIPASSTDSLTLIISYIGYQNLQKRILPNKDQELTLLLDANSELLQEIVVTEDANRQLIDEVQMGKQKITSKSIKTIPMVLGETDLLKVVQLSAGVQGGSEGTSGIFVRGGGYDQNLILLDEATVYNPEHFFGFFSTFNSDIVKNLEIYKSDFPARYGGRLSSVIDIQMREGNMKKFEGQGGVGLIASRLSLEGAIVKDKSSFVISARRTYADLFIPAVNKQLPDDQQIPNYFFYDLNAKVNYIIGDKDRVYLSGYFGRDKLNVVFDENSGASANSTYDLDWGNLTGTLRWNHIFGPRLFSNTSLIASKFDYKDRFNFNDFFFFRSAANTYTYSLKQDFDYYVSNKHHLQFGFQLTHNDIQPTEFSSGTVVEDEELATSSISKEQKYDAEEIAVYALDKWKLNSKLTAKIGLRYSTFITEERTSYSTFEPRLALNYKLDERTAIKSSYARMAQYLHQVKFSHLSFLDPVFPSNKNIAPQLSDQISVGWNRLVFNDKFSLTNEYYYKWLDNQLDYKNGAPFLFIDENYHERLTVGKGWTYGGEFQLQKTKGKTTGWLAYTLSWSKRQFDELNNGEAFPFTYDRRHVINVVAQHQLKNNWSLSANFTYQTGVTYDLPVGRFFNYGIRGQDPEIIPIYEAKNAFRMAPYHRLDVGLIKKYQSKGRWKSELVFNIYNLYSRRNPFFIYFDNEVETFIDSSGNEAQRVKYVAKQTSLFPIIPSVTYNFKF